MIIKRNLEIENFAKTIIDENHNILNPKIYLKHRIENKKFEEDLKVLIDTDKVDYVLFSSRSGAEEHIDKHLTHLDIYTYIIPIILPNAKVELITKNNGNHFLALYQPIKINHQEPHSLKVITDEPLVLVMASKVL